MKKVLAIGLMAVGAVATSYGQGHIAFDNYDSTPYMPVVWGAGNSTTIGTGTPGTGVATNGVLVDLLYTLGTAPAATNDLGLAVAINPLSVDSTPQANHGYFEGGAVTIPGYTTGPVTLQVEGWLAVGPFGGSTYAASQDKGISEAWQEATLATGNEPVGDFSGLPGPNGAPLLALVVPEPSILALSGIGAAALMLIRRKK